MEEKSTILFSFTIIIIIIFVEGRGCKGASIPFYYSSLGVLGYFQKTKTTRPPMMGSIVASMHHSYKALTSCYYLIFHSDPS